MLPMLFLLLVLYAFILLVLFRSVSIFFSSFSPIFFAIAVIIVFFGGSHNDTQ